MALGKHVLLVAGVALFVRLGFLAWGLSDVPMTPPSTQADVYLVLGYGIAAGYGYIEPVEGAAAEALVERLRVAVEDEGQRLAHLHAGPLPDEGWIPRTLHPPGMALIIAGLHKLTGGRVGFLLQVLGGLLDVATAVVVLLLVRSLWSKRLGLATGLAYAAFPPAAFLTTSRGSECFLPLFVVGTVYALLRGVRSSGRSAWGWYALAGVLTGLGALLRPDYLFLPLFMIPAVAWMGRGWRHAVAALVLAQVMAVLCLVPWGARNNELVGRWVLTSTSVGATLITSLGGFHNP